MSTVLTAQEPSAKYLAQLQPPLVQHFDLIAQAPGGVARLRELILTLAVQGKLVPQDPSDEPASELLKKIRAEKDQLIAEGKIKRDKSLAEIADEEKPFELPHGWVWCPLGEAIDIIRGITFPASEKTKVPAPGRIACLRTANVQSEIEWGDLLFVDRSFMARAEQVVQPGDIVMSMANSRELVGKVALVHKIPHPEATFGGFLGVLRPWFSNPQYAMAFLRTRHARDTLIDSSSQTTNIANISLAKLRPLAFPLPPLAEQSRIVTRVEELMQLCDALEASGQLEAQQHAQLVGTLLGTLTQSETPETLADNWQRIATHFDLLLDRPEAVDALEQTILQLAVRGLLVPQDPSDEPASVLLQKIRTGKDHLIAQGKIKRDKPLPPITDVEKPFALPVGWSVVRLSDLVRVLNGRAYSKPELLEAGPIPVLRVGNLFTSNHWYYSDLELETDKLCVEGDLLYAWSASFGPFIWAGPKAIFHYHIWKLDPFAPSHIDVQYLHTFLLEKTAEIKAAGHGVSMVHMTKEKMEKIVVPLPPLAEQSRIIFRLNELRTLCADLRESQKKTQSVQSYLADALVAV